MFDPKKQYLCRRIPLLIDSVGRIYHVAAGRRSRKYPARSKVEGDRISHLAAERLCE